MGSVIAAAVFAALLTQAAPAPELVVRAAESERAPCPVAAPLAASLRRQLPRVRVVEGGSLGQDNLGVSLLPEAGTWRLRVERANGELALARDIEGGASSCSDVAEVGALMVERYLTEVPWAGRDAVIGDLAGKHPTLVAAAPAPSLGRPASIDQIGAAAGLAVLLAPAESAMPALSFEASARLRSVLRVSTTVLLGTDQQQPVEIQGGVRGSLATRPLIGLVGAGICRSTIHASLCGGLAGGAAVLTGSARGQIYRLKSGLSMAPLAGAYARVGRSLPLGFEASAVFQGVVPLVPAELAVEGTLARRATPLLYGVVLLQLGWRFF